MKYLIVNIFFIGALLACIPLVRHFHSAPSVFGWLAVLYLLIIFCGSYFIQLNFFFTSIHAGGSGEKEIALSFDDGPQSTLTPAILDLLREKKLESIFFCIGKNIPGNERLLTRMVDEGHIIGNHSYSHHAIFDLFSAGKMLTDMKKMNDSTKAATGLIPRFFRPPYGVTNPNLGKAVARGGFISIGWSIRSLDTVIHNEDRLRKKVLSALKPGAILLFHDTSATTVSILRRLIQEIEESGYRIVRLDKMLKLDPYA